MTMTVFPNIEISLTQQCMFFLWSVLLGVVTGILYDVFRIIRIAFRHNAVMVFFEDILFCMITSCMLILMIFCANYGIVRWFSVMGCAAGFFIYFETAGKAVVGAAGRIISFIKRYIVSPITSLASWAVSWLMRAVIVLFGQLKRLVSALRRGIFTLKIMLSARNGFGL